MIKKTFLFGIIFALGMVCGFWGSQIGNTPGHSPLVEKNQEKPESSENNPEATLSPARILSEHFLPSTAPYWVLADFEKWRELGEKFNPFCQQPKITQFWQEFCASIPQGVTSALNELIDRSQGMQLFVIPPKDNVPAPALIAHFRLKEASEELQTIPGISTLLSALPHSATGEIPAGQYKIQTIATPVGDLAYFKQDEIVWLCNQPNVLVHFFNEPPPPPADPESIPPHVQTLDGYPDTVCAFFANPVYPGDPLPGYLGVLTQLLRRIGVKQTALLFQCTEDSGKMTFLSPSMNPLPWASQWLPIKEYPFGLEDPAGLIETAIRWPSTTISSATGMEGIPTPLGPFASLGNSSRSKANPPGRNRNTLPRHMQKQLNKMKPHGKNRLSNAAAQMQYQVLKQIIPSGKTVGFNVFGFYQGKPTLTLAVPHLEPGQFPLQNLVSMPVVDSSSIEIAMLPGTVYQFSQSPMSQMTGIEELLSIERDEVTYLFDAKEAAKKYMTHKDNERSTEMRTLLDHVKSPAQINTVFSRDFFRYLIDSEKAAIPDNFEHKDDLSALFDELYDYTQAMSLSAGLDKQTWFMETYSQDPAAHWVDTGLLAWAAYRFMTR